MTEINLPELKGSEKQIKWAESIREKIITTFNDYSKNKDILNKLLKKTEAKFWIETRDFPLDTLIEKIVKKEKKEKEQKEKTIYPNIKLISANVVRIEKDDDENIKLFFEKNETFRKLVKYDLGYTWNYDDYSWDKKTYNFIKEEIEVACRLLKKGFKVSLYNKLSIEKVKKEINNIEETFVEKCNKIEIPLNPALELDDEY